MSDCIRVIQVGGAGGTPPVVSTVDNGDDTISVTVDGLAVGVPIPIGCQCEISVVDNGDGTYNVTVDGAPVGDTIVTGGGTTAIAARLLDPCGTPMGDVMTPAGVDVTITETPDAMLFQDSPGLTAGQCEPTTNNAAGWADGSPSTDPGFDHQTALGSPDNKTSGESALVSGGDGTGATLIGQFIYGGATANAATGNLSTAIGGTDNTASQEASSAIGGFGNDVSGFTSSAIGGRDNTVSGDFSTVLGGVSNTASGYSGASLGDVGCTLSGSQSGSFVSNLCVVTGQRATTISSDQCTIEGDQSVAIATQDSIITTVSQNCVVVGGGNLLIDDASDQVAMGAFNEPRPGYEGLTDLSDITAVALIIGDGKAKARRNAHELHFGGYRWMASPVGPATDRPNAIALLTAEPGARIEGLEARVVVAGKSEVFMYRGGAWEFCY